MSIPRALAELASEWTGARQLWLDPTQPASVCDASASVSNVAQTGDTGVKHRTVISDDEAPGLLGFFYRNFGRANTGGALLKSYKAYFENQDPWTNMAAGRPTMNQPQQVFRCSSGAVGARLATPRRRRSQSSIPDARDQ